MQRRYIAGASAVAIALASITAPVAAQAKSKHHRGHHALYGAVQKKGGSKAMQANPGATGGNQASPSSTPSNPGPKTGQ